MKNYLLILLLSFLAYSFTSQAQTPSSGEDEGRCAMTVVIMNGKGMNVTNSMLQYYSKYKATLEKVTSIARGVCANSPVDSPCTRNNLSNFEFNFMKGAYLSQKYDAAPPQEPPKKNIDVLQASCMTQFK